MPCAAPGEIAREALHQILPEYHSVYERNRLVYDDVYTHINWMEPRIRPGICSPQLISSFTPQNPDFRVERGRLGEVESLVRDCRPPPPGNPHRPINRRTIISCDGWLKKYQILISGLSVFIPSCTKKRGEFSSIIRLHSFNRIKRLSNLKILNYAQYFKKTRSFLSCADRIPVLRFLRSHSHLYGIKQVGSPPIVVTFVLEKQG